MAENSAIEWTDCTWNPVAGCSPVSPGCTNCYAATMARRLEAMGQKKYAGTAERRGRVNVFTGVINTDPDALSLPLRWRKPRRIFVNSMSDLFHEGVPDQFIRIAFGVMSLAGQHTFQVLTKRPERMAAWFADEVNNLSACQAEWTVADLPGEETPTGKSRVRDASAINGSSGPKVGEGNYWPLPNVWLGTSVEDRQRTARINILRHVPAAVRFLSVEPLLEDVGTLNLDGIHWLICGGESGPGARPMHPDWARSIRDQCQAAGVAFFFKQWGGWAPTAIVPGGDLGGDVRRGHTTIMSRTGEENDGHFRRTRGDEWISRVGKKAAGRLLDGREWNESPEAAHV